MYKLIDICNMIELVCQHLLMQCIVRLLRCCILALPNSHPVFVCLRRKQLFSATRKSGMRHNVKTICWTSSRPAGPKHGCGTHGTLENFELPFSIVTSSTAFLLCKLLKDNWLIMEVVILFSSLLVVGSRGGPPTVCSKFFSKQLVAGSLQGNSMMMKWILWLDKVPLANLPF